MRKNKEFEQVYRRGMRLYGDGFTLICTKNDLGFNRLGISIHRRVKGAVRRNRIKRIIRESFRLNRKRYPQNADIVMAVKPVFSATSPEAVTEAVSHLTFQDGIPNEH
ncbi:MAG TPA: ribonuclease P protein component [Desulfopila sp.]|nr:ribonuclease P protein component [Desulfopila sp.]